MIIVLGFPLMVVGQNAGYHRAERLMGCNFDLTVVAADEGSAKDYLDLAVAEIQRIERLISSWDSTSQTSAINRMAGTAPVVVDRELFDLIQRANGISRLTDGAFDLTYAALDRIWAFDGSMTRMPDREAVRASVAKVGYRHIRLDPESSSVYLPEAGMKIGFGAIGKGYAADRARELLERAGVKGGIINASGDLTAWGTRADGQEWKVAITNPLNREKAFAWFPISDRAVVTSGDYEKFVTFEGVRYTHIIDPRTGYPSSGIVSATVFAPKAELADALATAVFVMGIETGLDFINQLPEIDLIIVDEKNQLHVSNGIDLEVYRADN
ncbi:thiamine biosynthesis lipoprotein [Lewinella aquimaris]|uniref:FAD:protein FMN transferase n=2 Tax=Neolewinella aquimaris TaxID=1835722 RepID=A0A840E0X7_9BACT|nr:FAD:protein FMN transferase [Neolewinella aquimaris]MBB4077603.1 thiamine biosynthesis lipoprotein [Neolewinella aquimaris]